MSTDVLAEIFEYLGPATQRILGSTCRKMYNVYKMNYHEKAIIVSWNEDRFYKTQKVSQDYKEIIYDWVVPSYVRTIHRAKDGIFGTKEGLMKESAEFEDKYLTTIMMRLREQIHEKQHQMEKAKHQEEARVANEKRIAEAAARTKQINARKVARKMMREQGKMEEAENIENIASSSKEAVEDKQEEEVSKNPKFTERIKSWVGFLRY